MAVPKEQAEDSGGHRPNRQPAGEAVQPVRVIPQGGPHGAGDCRQDDEGVEAVSPQERPQPAHAVNVVEPPVSGVLPKDEVTRAVQRQSLVSFP